MGLHRHARRAAGLLAITLPVMLMLPATGHAADRSGLGCSTNAPAGVTAGPAWSGEVVELINQHRASMGLVRLTAEPTLGRIATWKARDMVSRLLGDHEDQGIDGRPSRSFQERALTCGFGTAPVGENLAMGAASVASAQKVVDEWLRSPSHKANIERASWRYMGLGAATGQGGEVIGFAQVFSEARNVAHPSCSTASVYARIGTAVKLRSKLCRTDGSPVLLGAAPTRGKLKGLRYVPARRTGTVNFVLHWPDTGVRQPVEIYVRKARSKARMTKLRCNAARRCSTRATLTRPASSTRARLVVQQRVRGRWRTVRRINLRTARGTIRTTKRTTLPRGRVRVRVEIARSSIQSASRSAWQTRTMR